MAINWQWAYQQLKFPVNSVSTRTDDPKQELITNAEETEILIQEFDHDISEVETGGLKGWNVMYSLNATLNNIDLITIEGETLDEKSEFLKKLFVDEGISCSTDPSNVIAVLERKTEASPESEYIVPVFTVKHEDFKRQRVGGVRVFYKMDQVLKKMIFWVYQKQANGYDFTGI